MAGGGPGFFWSGRDQVPVSWSDASGARKCPRPVEACSLRMRECLTSGVRVGADNSGTRGDSRYGPCNRGQLFRSWWIHVAFSLEDDVETFWAAPTQLSGPGVSCFTRDRPPAADRQTRMAPISFVLSIWSRLHTPRLVSPSSVDYRDPGNLGRQSGHQPLVDELV